MLAAERIALAALLSVLIDGFDRWQMGLGGGWRRF
jgi:hypothetical protein